MSASGKRKENQPSSSLGRKQKTSIPQRFQGRGGDYQGQGRVKASIHTGQMTGYHFHQPRNMIYDCPQRLGSRNYGTAQSQSSVGHAWTQFVPSHPSTGQRDQYQSQGATQTPSATQTSQRGQGMGRG